MNCCLSLVWVWEYSCDASIFAEVFFEADLVVHTPGHHLAHYGHLLGDLRRSGATQGWPTCPSAGI